MVADMFGPGDDYAGRPGPQEGDKPCAFALFELVASVVIFAVLLLGALSNNTAKQASHD